ncbi:MAG TPA: hypothetical protein VJ910_04785 [Desulfuromonadales bacterium]|nr:hypothetical protein [Desulfuromonadales bacterium]
MPKSYTFTTKNYPTNDLLELDLENHINQMAEADWELVCTQQLIKEYGAASPRMILFWVRAK